MFKYICLLALVLAFACNRNQSDPTSSSSTSVTTTDAVTQTEYDSNTGLTWPTPKAEGEADTVEKNLTKKNYYVVFDGSGSMASSDCAGVNAQNQPRAREDVAKEALIAFSDKIPSDANLGLLVFDNEGVREVVELQENNKAKFISAVQASRNGGGTPLASSMIEAVKKLGVQARKQLGYGTYDLIVVTDGESSYGENPGDVVNFAVAKTPISIHTIGFCIDSSHSLNQPEKVSYKSATNPEELSKGLESVLAESETFSVDSFSK